MCLTLRLKAEGHDLSGNKPCKPCGDYCTWIGPICGCGEPDCTDYKHHN